MSILEWSERLDVHVSAMNDEHKQLIGLMNHLHTKVQANAPRSEQGRALKDLAAYTVRHFEDEEKYMVSIGFPGLATHKGVHRQLLERVTGYIGSFEGGAPLGKDFFDFLRFWLTAHIAGVDAKYGQHAAGAQPHR